MAEGGSMFYTSLHQRIERDYSRIWNQRDKVLWGGRHECKCNGICKEGKVWAHTYMTDFVLHDSREGYASLLTWKNKESLFIFLVYHTYSLSSCVHFYLS